MKKFIIRNMIMLATVIAWFVTPCFSTGMLSYIIMIVLAILVSVALAKTRMQTPMPIHFSAHVVKSCNLIFNIVLVITLISVFVLWFVKASLYQYEYSISVIESVILVFLGVVLFFFTSLVQNTDSSKLFQSKGTALILVITMAAELMYYGPSLIVGTGFFFKTIVTTAPLIMCLMVYVNSQLSTKDYDLVDIHWAICGLSVVLLFFSLNILCSNNPTMKEYTVIQAGIRNSVVCELDDGTQFSYRGSSYEEGDRAYIIEYQGWFGVKVYTHPDVYILGKEITMEK